MIEIIVECPICHNVYSVTVDFEDYCNWEAGEHAQDAFPYLSAEERELLISGICAECWADMW